MEIQEESRPPTRPGGSYREELGWERAGLGAGSPGKSTVGGMPLSPGRSVYEREVVRRGGRQLELEGGGEG